MGLFKPNVEKMKRSNDVAGLINALQHDDYGIQCRAVDALATVGNRHTVQLLSRLAEDRAKGQSLQCRAIETLEKMGRCARSAAPVPRRLVNDPDGFVSRAASKAIGSIDTNSKDAITALISRLGVEGAAADEALARIGAPAVPYIVKKLETFRQRARHVSNRMTGSTSCFSPELCDALCALREIGPAAKSAVPAVLRLVEDLRKEEWDHLFYATSCVAAIDQKSKHAVVGVLATLHAKGCFDEEQIRNLMRQVFSEDWVPPASSAPTTSPDSPAMLPESMTIMTPTGIPTLLFQKGSLLPCETKRVFRVPKDDPTTIEFSVLCGDAPKTEGNTVIGAYRIAGISPVPEGSPQVEVCFKATSPKRLLVQARHLSPGGRAELVRLGDSNRTLADAAVESERAKAARKAVQSQNAKAPFEEVSPPKGVQTQPATAPFACPFKNTAGKCVAPNEADGPPCSFEGTDYERLCAVYPLHMARKRGRPLSATEATTAAYERGLAQERPDSPPAKGRDNAGVSQPAAATEIAGGGEVKAAQDGSGEGPEEIVTATLCWNECGGPIEATEQGAEADTLPFEMSTGGIAMLPVCPRCYLEAQRGENGEFEEADAPMGDAVLVLFLFNSENLPSGADAGYGALAETLLLKHLFEAWQTLSQHPIAETELRASHGDLFEEHILGDDACTLYVLGRMMHRPGVDATLLPSGFCEAMRMRQRVGFIPWAVGLSPVPVPVVRHVNAELAREFPEFYIGAVQFPSSHDFSETAERLQLPRTLGIRGGKCFGDWLGRPPRLTHTQDGHPPAAAVQEPAEQAADDDVAKKALPIAQGEDVAAMFRTPRSGVGIQDPAFGTPLADTGLEFQLRRLTHAHQEMRRAKRRTEGRDLRTPSVVVLFFAGACILGMFTLATGVIAIYGEDPKDAPLVCLLSVYLVPIAIGVLVARRTRRRRAAKARSFLVEAESRLAREVHSCAVSHPEVVEHVLGDRSRLLEKESVDELADILLTRRQILCAGKTTAGNRASRHEAEEWQECLSSGASVKAKNLTAHKRKCPGRPSKLSKRDDKGADVPARVDATSPEVGDAMTKRMLAGVDSAHKRRKAMVQCPRCRREHDRDASAVEEGHFSSVEIALLGDVGMASIVRCPHCGTTYEVVHD